jgi:hypothetical protein
LLLFLTRRCDSIRRDVLEDEYTRGTAFVLDPVEKEADDEEYFLEDERDSDERYEESNATREVTGKKKLKTKKLKVKNPQKETFFRNFVVGLQG